MSTTLDISKFGLVISDQKIGNDILLQIEKSLKVERPVVVDFRNVKSMATFCAKQIFGYLYLKLTPEKFYDSIVFKDVNDDLKVLIKIGIQNAIEEGEGNLTHESRVSSVC